MIDIHSHLLFSVDDGSKALEESITVLKNLEQVGYTDIILTPHYIEESKYTSNRENNLLKLNVMQDSLQKKKIFQQLFTVLSQSCSMIAL